MSDKRVNVNQSETAGNTALIMAALRGQSKVVEQLLKDQRVEVIQRNNFGQSALIIAASMKHIDVVQLFLNDKRVKVNSTTLAIPTHHNDLVFSFPSQEADSTSRSPRPPSSTPRPPASLPSTRRMAKEVEDRGGVQCGKQKEEKEEEICRSKMEVLTLSEAD